MSPSTWGPSTWLFIHTLAAKIKDSSFPLIAPSLLLILIQICNNLPLNTQKYFGQMLKLLI